MKLPSGTSPSCGEIVTNRAIVLFERAMRETAAPPHRVAKNAV